MPPRNPKAAPAIAPRRPDRDHVRRLVETILHLGAYDKAEQLRKAWWTLFDLVNIPEAHAPRLVYHFRLGNLPTDDPDRLADLLLAEFDETAAGMTPAD